MTLFIENMINLSGRGSDKVFLIQLQTYSAKRRICVRVRKDANNTLWFVSLQIRKDYRCHKTKIVRFPWNDQSCQSP